MHPTTRQGPLQAPTTEKVKRTATEPPAVSPGARNALIASAVEQLSLTSLETIGTSVERPAGPCPKGDQRESGKKRRPPVQRPLHPATRKKLQAKQEQEAKRIQQARADAINALRAPGDTDDDVRRKWDELDRADFLQNEAELEELRQAGRKAKEEAEFQKYLAEYGDFGVALAKLEEHREAERTKRQEEREARREAKHRRQRAKEARAAYNKQQQKKRAARKERLKGLEQANNEQWAKDPQPATESETLAHDLRRADRQEKDTDRRSLKTLAWKALQPYNPRAARQMDLCERTGRRYTCKACGTFGVVPIGCDKRGCPVCDPQKADQDAQAYGPMFEGEFVRFATFTLPNVELQGAPPGADEVQIQKAIQADALRIREALQTLSKAFRLLRQAARFKRALKGGFWKREITLKAREGRVYVNPHLHVMFWGQFIPQADLSDAWHKRTGARVVDIRKAPPIREAVKYSAKAYDYRDDKKRPNDPAHVTRGQSFQTIERLTEGRFPVGYLLAVWIAASRSLHLIRCFGDGFKFLPPEQAAICPDCGASHWHIVTCRIPYYPNGPPRCTIWRGADLYPEKGT